MPKIFDYKFLIILGLSLVVYFLYTEVDTLNKRVSKLELNNAQLDVKNTKKQIELPPPPTESNDEVEGSVEETVEEYSNEETPVQVYSHDKLDTNTNDNEHDNEHDTPLVESVINMVKHSEHDEEKEEVQLVKDKQTVEQLLKLKLDELQARATELEIDINNENGKKKRKVDLANDIFNKLQ